jgi:hypothetical protein
LAQGNAERPGSCVSIKEQIWRRPGTARWGIADYSPRKVCMGSSLAARAAASHTAAKRHDRYACAPARLQGRCGT